MVLHFKDEETEVQRGLHQFPQTHSAGLWWSQDMNPGP